MWNALTSSSNFVLESLETFAESTGVAGLFANMGWGSLIMICVAFFLLYLAIKHKFEPLLLLTIAFGMLLTNLPGANLYHTELFAGGHVHWDIFVAQAGLLDYLYLGVKLGIYPCLIFVGVGAMTDFGPLIANPKSFLLGAAAQIGIFLTFIGAYALGFSPAEAGSIGIIGGADGPTAIFVTSQLAPHLLGAIAVAAYSYMALVPIIQPVAIKAVTTKKERQIQMKYNPVSVSKGTKIAFPIIVTIIVGFISPSSVALVGFLMFGNLVRECGVLNNLSNTAQNELANLITLLLGITISFSMRADAFVRIDTVMIMVIGLVAFVADSMGGVLFAKFLNLFLKEKMNPMIGAAGISAFPMSSRVIAKMAKEEDPYNFILMQAAGANVAGQVASVIAGGIILALVGPLG